jgi:hypothetical protein
MISETEPIAMVCIGGMDGVIAEAHLFRDLTRKHRLVFALPSTGGAASILTEDDPALAEVEQALSDTRHSVEKNYETADDPPIIPYPLIMQTIVQRIADSR